MPAIGIGTRRGQPPDVIYEAVTNALRAGYRHIGLLSQIILNPTHDLIR